MARDYGRTHFNGVHSKLGFTTGDVGNPTSLVGMARQEWEAPDAAANTGVLGATTLVATDPLVVTTGFTNPDFARDLRLVSNNASQVGNAVIVGTDINGEALTETVVLNGTTPVNTTRAFKTVTQVTLPPRFTAGVTVTIGIGVKFGLAHLPPVSLGDELDPVISVRVDGVADAHPTVSLDADVLALNTITFDTAPNAARNYAATLMLP